MTTDHADFYQLADDVRVLTPTEVDALLRKGHGWARRNVVALGGYETDTGRFHFPVAGIRAWQEQQAAAYAATQRRHRVVPFKRRRGGA